MIDIATSQANQTGTESGLSDWTVTLGDELLYSMPSHFTVQDTFLVRGIVESMMKRAETETKESEQQLCLIKMEHIVKHGDGKLAMLKDENERLATALEQHILNEEVA